MEGRILGFQFEPLREINKEPEFTDDVVVMNIVVDENSIDRSNTDPVEWCSCGLFCEKMPTNEECLCCKEVDTIDFRANNGKNN